MSTDAPTLKAPYPYFGGKSRVAAEVWRRFGDVRNVVDPFFGSNAILLARPEPFDGTETINDLDGFVPNFWRAVNADPDAVAAAMNWPVMEVCLEARHKWLVTADRKAAFLERMKSDPEFFDVKTAAWWCWGLGQWIGSGWCCGEWHGGKLPHLLHAGRGVHKQLPHLLHAGRGVHKQLPHLGDAGRGECARRGEVLRQWMQALCDRLRNVRVCCGDWKRVLGPSVTVHNGLTAVFLDPPYSAEAGRGNDIYRCEDLDVAHAVREWAVEHGNDPLMRIALCGYEGEHDMPADWDCFAWKTQGGYANQRNAGMTNRHRERIWFSRHCLTPTNHRMLF